MEFAMTAESMPDSVAPASITALNDMLVWSLAAFSLAAVVIAVLFFVFRGAIENGRRIRQEAAVRASRASRAPEERDAGQP